MEQKIYPKETHGISLDQIDREALYVLEKLTAAGFTAYLVGGSVRDLLLGHKPKDFDISTSAEPEQIKKIFRNCVLIGRRFRLAHIRFGRKIIEVSTFRAGDNQNDQLIVRDNVWGSPEEDVLRRDFTINGLFYDAKEQTIIDYTGGYTDAKNQYLKTIGQPFLRFKQDPVRMLRLLKFQARFNFNVDPAVHVALLECRQEITKSSPARIQEELLRMLESGASYPFFHLLTEHSLLPLLTPVLGHFLESEHKNEVFAYLKEIDSLIKEDPKHPPDRPVLLACLAFPLFTRKIAQIKTLGKPLHLGEIFEEACDLVHEIFRPFFPLSRRLSSSLSAILTIQYKITPLEKKKHRKIRIPRDPDFAKALEFFELRADLEPALKNTLKEWQDAYKTAHDKKTHSD